ncbi:hydrolase [Erysipelothrix larvae]|uniref:Hydrolase n=1 Tax=Erysipelothrix larvae TaxID=1514105 RepID=A0A0X8H1W3_9FIRM|nr:hydrolase [Erysipelothrix larvae]AMC94429.1 hydrolase [Erysipelothrix larvae]
MNIPEYNGNLRAHSVKLPEAIHQAKGIRIFGRLIRSLVFSTDIAVIRNCNADAVIAVYPFTPQPVISNALIMASDIPVFTGIGGGTTRGPRVINLAVDAERQGAMGVVVNAPTKNEVISRVRQRLEIPIVVTVLSENEDIEARLNSGATILNVSAAARTPEVVRKIREKFPDAAIMATGGPTNESILETIEAGANAITFTPPSTAELFKEMMARYRESL